MFVFLCFVFVWMCSCVLYLYVCDLVFCICMKISVEFGHQAQHREHLVSLMLRRNMCLCSCVLYLYENIRWVATSGAPGVFNAEKKQGEKEKEAARSKQQKLSPHLDFSNVLFQLYISQKVFLKLYFLNILISSVLSFILIGSAVPIWIFNLDVSVFSNLEYHLDLFWFRIKFSCLSVCFFSNEIQQISPYLIY